MTTTQPSSTLSNDKEYETLRYIGGRKFLVTLIVVFLTFLLVWFEKIEPGIYSVVIVAVVGAYIAGNVTQKINTGI